VVANGHVWVERYEFQGDRAEIMREATTTALRLIIDYLDVSRRLAAA